MATALCWSDIDTSITLGEGKSGTVKKAVLKRDAGGLAAGEIIAVKCYKNWVLEESGQFERIIRELQIGRTICHPNLVKCISLIRDDVGNPALVMPFYNGITLEAFLKDSRTAGAKVETEYGFMIMGDLASGLSALHKAGVVHRDLKPANIMMTECGPVIMDFGVVSSSNFPEQTSTGAFLGTIRYAAPEYLFGEEYNQSSDIYSFGSIAFEIFCSKKFLYSIDHWAQLVARKYRYTDSVLAINELVEICATVQACQGINVAEAVYFLLNNTLCESKYRKLDLEVLSVAIKNKFWLRSFYVEDGSVIETLPSVPDVIDGSLALIPIADFARHVKSILSSGQISYLTQWIEKCYWDIRCSKSYVRCNYSVLPLMMDKAIVDQLVRLNICTLYNCDGGEIYYKIDNAVIMSYRYGLLQ